MTQVKPRPLVCIGGALGMLTAAGLDGAIVFDAGGEAEADGAPVCGRNDCPFASEASAGWYGGLTGSRPPRRPPHCTTRVSPPT